MSIHALRIFDVLPDQKLLIPICGFMLSRSEDDASFESFRRFFNELFELTRRKVMLEEVFLRCSIVVNVFCLDPM